MMEEMLPEVNKKDGRYGMDFWKIFVLHVVSVWIKTTDARLKGLLSSRYGF